MRKKLFILSYASMAFFLALTALLVRTGNEPAVFASSLLMWMGYLASHRTATGKFVDGYTSGEKDSKFVPKPGEETVGSITGAAIFVTGMITGVFGLQRQSLPLTFVAASVFLTGYALMHYATTGELL